MAPMTAELEWKDTGSLERTGRGHENWVSPLCQWPAGVHGALPTDDGEKTKTLWVRIRGQGQVTLHWGSATGHQTKKAEQMRPSTNRCEHPHVHKLWSMWGTSKTSITVGQTTQHGISNAEVSWTVLLITSSLSDRGDNEKRSWNSWWGMWTSSTASAVMTMKWWRSRSLGKPGWCTTSSVTWTSEDQTLVSSESCLVECWGIKPWREEGPKKAG